MPFNPRALFRFKVARALFPLTCLVIPIALAAEESTPPPDLSGLSLDALLNVEVTSVSRKQEKLSHAAAAIFVITQEDIRRSGLTSIPELLRIVPGMDVAQMDANKWAVTSRGFNERFADKMQVLIDGRSVLTPLSSGVYWDVQDTMLEDIERIEVVRGPGATLWGANAVNGVINIITKKAKDTQGVLVTESSGSQERDTSSVRYGGEIGNRGQYRIFAKYLNRDGFSDSHGQASADGWNILRGGFRSDWQLSKRDDVTVQGDLYSGSAGQTVAGILSFTPALSGTFRDRSDVSGGNLLARWNHTSSERFDTSLQMYLVGDDRNQHGVLNDNRRTVDVEIVQHLALNSRHNIIWGGDYRHDLNRTVGSLNITFDEANRGTNLFGAFFQDDITLSPDRVRVTLGAKLEHNSYSGFATQPNVRLLWTPGPTRSLWMAVSHAAENSSRFDADIQTNDDVTLRPDGVTVVNSTFGKDPLPPESVTAYEFGFRGQMGKGHTFDVATFYNRYAERHTHEPGLPFFEGIGSSMVLILPTVTASNITGETHGIEISTMLPVSKSWKLIPGYTLFETHLHASSTSLDFLTARESEGSSPRHQFQVRSMVNLPHKVEFDSALYYVGQLSGPQVPQHTRVDVRIGWRPMPHAEFSAGIQNLLGPPHFEFGSGDLVSATQVERNIYAKLTWRL